MERTLIIFKPDCVQRRLVGRVLARFEDKGFNLIALKMMRITPELANATMRSTWPRAGIRRWRRLSPAGR